jgi:hypothetical protein
MKSQNFPAVDLCQVVFFQNTSKDVDGQTGEWKNREYFGEKKI